jgi:hypothetical protein
MMQLCPVTRPSEEVRFSLLRNLKSYVSEQALRMIAEEKGRRE